MEKQRSTKVIAVVALIAAVFGLSIGFAAYSRTLNITNIDATVTPGESELDVFFDNDQTKDNALEVVKGTGTGALSTEEGATITNPALNSGTQPTISGFTANFTAKGQSVVYTFYVYNNSPYNAYLNAVSFTGAEPHKSCEATAAGTNATLVQNACNDITLSLKVGTDTILSTNSAAFKSHTIAAGAWQPVVVEIAYDGTTYPLPDGDMKVTFDGIQLSYTTIAQ